MKQIFAKYRFFPVSMLIGFLVLSTCLVLRGGPALAAAAHTGISGSAAAGLPGRDPGRQVLPENDGWASADGGTTGGANAAADHVYVVTNRAQLVQALGGDNSGADATP